jgi:beta-N-acetylhexosaminidase
MRTAMISGVAGEVLTVDESAWLRRVRPCGLILFKRNCASRHQMAKLIGDVREAIGADDLLVLIDQEGGRVQRLQPPLGRTLPPGAAYGMLYQRNRDRGVEAARLVARLVAKDLKALGINTNCAPVLDVPVAGSHAIIGDRAYGMAVPQVVALGRAVRDGYAAGGALPVVKHIPGHGRSTKDSHLDLPVVTTPWPELSATDFSPFRALADSPAAMSAHVVFTAIDAGNPASTSRVVHDRVIRGEIGFDGLLMSDDLSMAALSGSIQERAEAVIRAGSDLTLHCNGDLAEMEAAAAGSPPLAGRALQRFERAMAVTRRSEPFDAALAEALLDEVLATNRAESV